jgi:hypothetical protein
MNGYENGKIYRIECNGLAYYGSTKQTLQRRLIQHICLYNKYLRDNKGYYSSFEILKLEGYKIELVEDYPCSSKKELEIREKYYITNYECCNNRIPTRTIKEYIEANKEAIIKYQKEYCQANKQTLDERNKAYREANRDVINRKQNEKYHAKKVKVIN